MHQGRPWWDVEPDPEPPRCELCGATGVPLFAGHDQRGKPVDRCEDMAACRQRREKREKVTA